MPRGGVSEQVLLTGIKQGAGKAVSVSFGSGKGKGNGNGKKKGKAGKNTKKASKGPGSTLACWDAFNPTHLPLPRAVAPYTIIRTTAIWDPDSDDQRRFCLFGPRLSASADAGQWTSYYAMSSNQAMTGVTLQTASGASNWAFNSMTTDSWAAASVTPAAFSIQVMNPEALQTSEGMLYIGRCHNKVHVAESDLSRTWFDIAEELVSYSNPRLCSAGKLALRGVQIDAVPNNMSELSKFTSLRQLNSNNFTLASNNSIHGEGFNPIFLYNPKAVKVQVLVCCEWRVRFDPSNPAYAACRAHRPATDGQWWNTMNKAIALGNGVVDVVERVAQLGKAVQPMLTN